MSKKEERKQKRALSKLVYTKNRRLFGHMTNVEVLTLLDMGFYLDEDCSYKYDRLKARAKRGEIYSTWVYFRQPKKELLKLVKKDLQ
jgi:hypothetical protein